MTEEIEEKRFIAVEELPKNEEQVVIKNGLLDLSIALSSHKISATKLIKEAEASLLRQIKTMPTKIPLGVN